MKQMIESDEFKKYDYGTDAANFKIYGTIEPPVYDLKKVTGFNLVLICGKTDKLAHYGDALRAKKLFENYGNNVKCLEYDCGHIGLLMPACVE